MFKDNIWAADLAKMGSLSSFNCGVKYLLCVIDVFIKYAWVKPLKYKKGQTLFRSFVKIVNKSERKPNKLRDDQRRELDNSLMQKWLDHNDILIYSSQNEAKSLVDERFIKTLKGKIYTKMTANDSKSIYRKLGKRNICN